MESVSMPLNHSNLVCFLSQYAVGHRDLGAMLHMNNKHEEALIFYERALELQPDDPVTLENLEKTRGKIKQKKQAEAREILAKAEELHKAGEAEEAEELFRKIVEITPDVSIALGRGGMKGRGICCSGIWTYGIFELKMGANKNGICRPYL